MRTKKLKAKYSILSSYAVQGNVEVFTSYLLASIDSYKRDALISCVPEACTGFRLFRGLK